MNNKEKGTKGELLAKVYFEQRGFTILEMNWRHSRAEVDLIASKENLLYFIEVKTRTSTAFGHPEEAVTISKMIQLKLAAEEYQYQNPQWKYIRFDVLSIMLINGKQPDYFLIEDVY